MPSVQCGHSRDTCNTKLLVLLYAGRRDKGEITVKSSKKLHKVYIFQICCFIRNFSENILVSLLIKEVPPLNCWISFHKKEGGFCVCVCVLAYLPDLVVFQARMSQFNWGRSLHPNLQTRWKWNIFNDSFPKNRWNRGMLTLLYFCQRLPTLRGNKLFSWRKSAEQTLKELKGYSQSWYTCFSLYLLP